MSKEIESILKESRKLSPSEVFRSKAHIRSFEDYKTKWEHSIRDPEGFWGEIASDFAWYQKWNKVRSYDFKDEIFIKWFEGAKTNITVNCLDRHVEKGLGDRVAIIWEGNEPGETRRITYRALLMSVCSMARVLKNLGVKKGDRITIYMPMIPEAAVAMLACARIGAVHSVIFGGFSAESIADRLIDANSSFIITADWGLRGSKKIPLKETVEEAIKLCEKAGHAIKTCVVYQRTGDKINWVEGRDHWWHELTPPLAHKQNVCFTNSVSGGVNNQVTLVCEAEKMDAEDPLFILYTSGSTGKPKGVLHTTAGYMVFAAATFKYVFDYKPEDIFWCTADVGWVTGHSYTVYGPLCNAATTFMFEGIPTYPQPDRFWDICERHKINIFYTAPTAIRALMREGESWVKKHNLSSLRLLGTVGEPINPEAWMWYYDVVGGSRCPIVDTWWQTETGGILITPLPGCTDLKPGSATIPFFGVNPKVLKEDGTECGVNEGGYLVITEPWPGIMRTVYGHHERFKETYFSKFPGAYYTGDGARKDEDGYFWLMGRLDDVLNVSGHRIGTAEVESALVSHPSVAEAAVVGFPHEIKGEGIYAFVTLKDGQKNSEDLKSTLSQHVRKVIGPVATPDKIQFAPALPKTRSGKIMRRILRKIASGHTENLGDTSTLADPTVVESLLEDQIR
ncbi:MAG: acetate--CoA ligase [Deltaproteobacteria bacterium RIFCSPLOWO2_12_FULL_44_12]|nr:MAG: acetate--CoA ligase [Deltaproteobacteria bacterium RIFCSPHIGHO2_01_FULL_43_49]OGQ15213.1 MAG: acetate--CoA ligase [Deltaproteobacteria bacterium RIFCSPHIGHO2_02_FULL_44_53]OGQ27164.1 MAG: acetate--CoA ligase [Deltaproteobacteria bacterium RIFCSPHIGHO2_12_FULL_44_21]OGQ31730.1 MAG: acetate--CoA ligase [Deltaproteobacteria bacterium RIFCSPLOWO2_01_FULL_45_74]OGQ42930.1 MAG: acetate--CoA ligase [Deltaproteobacteria bacterium RIFCSPLOWO2_02_FULL_44_34]OGQ69967.1 MAG: acetate--CoA ligase [D